MTQLSNTIIYVVKKVFSRAFLAETLLLLFGPSLCLVVVDISSFLELNTLSRSIFSYII
jgi:hypothetical protein